MIILARRKIFDQSGKVALPNRRYWPFHSCLAGKSSWKYLQNISSITKISIEYVHLSLTVFSHASLTQFTAKKYSDVIMIAMASQINGVSIVCSTVFSDVEQRKHRSSASLALVKGIHRSPVDSPSQRASNAEKMSIWWRHHETARNRINKRQSWHMLFRQWQL